VNDRVHVLLSSSTVLLVVRDLSNRAETRHFEPVGVHLDLFVGRFRVGHGGERVRSRAQVDVRG
jgi:hypothetical protein